MERERLLECYDFSGRTFVVTGGTGVLCRYLARALASCGASLAIVSRQRAKGEAIARELQGGSRSIAVEADVCDREGLRGACHSILQEFGRIDGLINGAGGNRPEATARPDLSFFQISEDALRRVVDLNLLGTILPSQVFAEEMARSGEGAVLNIASMSAMRPLTRVVGYSAAKAAVINFTQWLAVYLAKEFSPRLRVNAIAPGFFLGEQNRHLLVDSETGELTPRGRTILEHTPMGRFGQPEDLVGAALWLLSPAASFVTGVVVPVDGGFAAFSGV